MAYRPPIWAIWVMENKTFKPDGRLSKLLRKSPIFDCDEAFLSLTKYPNGDFCLRIKDHDSLEKSMSETLVFIQLMDIMKITQGNWASNHEPFEHGIWRLKNNDFIRQWLKSKFPSKSQLIEELGASDYGQ